MVGGRLFNQCGTTRLRVWHIPVLLPMYFLFAVEAQIEMLDYSHCSAHHLELAVVLN